MFLLAHDFVKHSFVKYPAYVRIVQISQQELMRAMTLQRWDTPQTQQEVTQNLYKIIKNVLPPFVFLSHLERYQEPRRRIGHVEPSNGT